MLNVVRYVILRTFFLYYTVVSSEIDDFVCVANFMVDVFAQSPLVLIALLLMTGLGSAYSQLVMDLVRGHRYLDYGKSHSDYRMF